MEHQEQTQIEEILLQYYTGSLNNEECEKVKEWIADSTENREIAQRIFTLSLAIDTRRMHKLVNTERSLKKLKGRLVVHKRKADWWEWTKRIAAVLFIPLVSLLFLQQYQKSPQEIQMFEIRTNPGMVTKLTLPDGTSVALNSESVLKYPSLFTGKVREVQLSGEAYFEVAKDSKRRFIVSTPYQSHIEVLGTHFNVEAYATDNFVATTLIEGKVGFVYRKAGMNKRILLEPGHKVIYSGTTDEVSLYKTSGISELSWKDGRIIFHNTPLEEALHMLEKSFHVEFIIKNEQLKKDSFTGTFTTQRLEKILEYFKVSSKIRWRYMNGSDEDHEKLLIEVF